MTGNTGNTNQQRRASERPGNERSNPPDNTPRDPHQSDRPQSDAEEAAGSGAISAATQTAIADELLGRVRDRILGGAGDDTIIEGMLLKAAINVTSNLPDNGTTITDAMIDHAIAAERVKTTAAISGSIEALRTELDNRFEDWKLKWRGEYDATIAYPALNIVSYLGSSYVAIADVPAGAEVPSASHPKWRLIAEKGDAPEHQWRGPSVRFRHPNGRWGAYASLQGPHGPAGIRGATGARGPQGVRGATGSTGPQGPRGATGSRGPTGPTGPRGPTGPSGSSNCTSNCNCDCGNN